MQKMLINRTDLAIQKGMPSAVRIPIIDININELLTDELLY